MTELRFCITFLLKQNRGSNCTCRAFRGGKSTIAKLLVGFWDQSSGEISIGGVDTNKISFKQLAEEISFVSQDNFLFDVSIRDNIRLGKPWASEDEIIAAKKSGSLS